MPEEAISVQSVIVIWPVKEQIQSNLYIYIESLLFKVLQLTE